MPGGATKAAILKCLDTGELDYDGLYLNSLVTMCKERGLRSRSGDTKKKLVKLLQEDDEKEDGE